MAIASKIVGALALVLLVLTASEGQVLPTPFCRIDCCDGKPECCEPGTAATVAAAVAPSDDVAAHARPAAAAAAGGAARKVSGGI
ncbi:hypothetical protein ABZP36_023222 [Zizania latifolia]